MCVLQSAIEAAGRRGVKAAIQLGPETMLPSDQQIQRIYHAETDPQSVRSEGPPLSAMGTAARSVDLFETPRTPGDESVVQGEGGPRAAVDEQEEGGRRAAEKAGRAKEQALLFGDAALVSFEVPDTTRTDGPSDGDGPLSVRSAVGVLFGGM
jgi:hypothetical protein